MLANFLRANPNPNICVKRNLLKIHIDRELAAKRVLQKLRILVLHLEMDPGNTRSGEYLHSPGMDMRLHARHLHFSVILSTHLNFLQSIFYKQDCFYE